MAKVKHNKFTTGLSGTFGNLVFRQMKDGRTILATRPDYTDHKWTADQQAHHNHFQQAVAYAREAARANPLYAKLAEGTSKNAYNIALSDWFNPPVIHEVSHQNGSILINATDNVQVTNVRITILDIHGQTLEQGDAKLETDAWWKFETSTEGKLIVEAFDLAGNCTKHEA